MGCDIHIWAEVKSKKSGKWHESEDVFTLSEWEREREKKQKGPKPFDWRSYSMYAFFADVRNYNGCDPISEPKGMPDDANSDAIYDYNLYSGDAHSASWLSVKELTEFDYDKTFENKRDGDNNCGKMVSYREELGEMFFTHLEELKQLGDPEDVRIVFFFDN